MSKIKGVDLATQLCAAAMAFLAFTTSMIIGLYVDNPFTTVIGRSVLCLFVFYILGAILSVIGQKVIKENFDAEAERLLQKSSVQSDDTLDIPQDNTDENSSEAQELEPALSDG